MSKKQTTQIIAVTVSPEELEEFKTQAFESFRRELELPGFRKGTVSADVAKQHVSDEAVFADAVERAISIKGAEAIKDIEDRMVGRPEVQVKKVAAGNPLEFTIEVHLLPEVDVSDWRQLRLAFKPKEVGEEDIEKSLDQLRESRVRTAAVNRAAAKGDLVDINFSTRISGVKVEGGESQNHPLVLGESSFVPGFDDAIIGLERGAEIETELTFPKDWPTKHLAGERAEFSIVLNNVMERTVPEANDEFAKSIGNFENLESLKKSIIEGLTLEREMEEKQRVRSEAVKKLTRSVRERDIPDMVIEQELGRMKEEFTARIEGDGLTLEQYLQQIGKEEDELEKDWQEAASDRVRATLIIRAIAKAENITPDQKVVDARSDELIKRQKALGAQAQQLDQDAVRSYTETIIVNEMTLDLIEGVVTGKA